jgi:hypothetical protein
LYECVMNKVFGLLAIMPGQLQRPPEQPTVSLHE